MTNSLSRLCGGIAAVTGKEGSWRTDGLTGWRTKTCDLILWWGFEFLTQDGGVTIKLWVLITFQCGRLILHVMFINEREWGWPGPRTYVISDLGLGINISQCCRGDFCCHHLSGQWSLAPTYRPQANVSYGQSLIRMGRWLATVGNDHFATFFEKMLFGFLNLPLICVATNISQC